MLGCFKKTFIEHLLHRWPARAGWGEWLVGICKKWVFACEGVSQKARVLLYLCVTYSDDVVIQPTFTGLPQ